MLMKEMQAVRTIDFNGKNLGDEGIAGLVTGFVYNTTVAEVNMASNGFTPEGMKYLVEGLHSTGSGCQIAKLNLDGNSFGDEGMALLGEYLQVGSQRSRSVQF
jgi:Ran GTPase-activating protein (RanGAP) involved in mRNA processing and transport